MVWSMEVLCKQWPCRPPATPTRSWRLHHFESRTRSPAIRRHPLIFNCTCTHPTFCASPRPTSQHRNMASVDARKRSLDGDIEAAAEPTMTRKKLKISDLPLTQNKRAAIEAILHTFKKRGEFDTLRKEAFRAFDQSVSLPSRLTSDSYQ